jgi:hypothetical protein
MDQRAARDAFDELSIDDAEWAADVLGAYRADIQKLRRPPKNAHLWLGKGMWRNYPRDAKAEAEPEQVWIGEGSEADKALSMLLRLVRKPHPFVRTDRERGRGWFARQAIGPDALAMLQFDRDNDLRWPLWPQGSPEFAAWQRRFEDWTGSGLPIVADDGGRKGIRAPTQWPPKRDGTLCGSDPPKAAAGEGEGEAV